MSATGIDPFLLVLLPVLAIAMPILGVRDYRRMLRKIREGDRNARRSMYLWTILLMWPLTAVFLAWWLLEGRGFEAIRLVPAASGWQWAGVAAGAAFAVFMLVQMVMVLRSREQMEKLHRQSGKLLELAPHTPVERRLFDLVSVTAGVCEEILYRGLLTAALTPVIGTWPAVAVTTVIFGLGHAYQGWLGLGKATLAGLIMALLVLASGSLYIAIVVHAVVDATGGRLMGAAATVTATEEAPQAAAS